MVIVAGHVMVDPAQRDAYVADMVGVVEKARRADGCLDFVMAPDVLEPGRLNLFERWESREALTAFRSRAPRRKRQTAMLSVAVAEYDIAGVRPLYGKGDG